MLSKFLCRPHSNISCLMEYTEPSRNGQALYRVSLPTNRYRFVRERQLVNAHRFEGVHSLYCTQHVV
jgi:hypothetical protein